MVIRIEPEFRDLIPPLAPDELAQLEANIVADGCREPLVVWGDILVDGHNRHAICTRLEIQFTTTAMQFSDRTSAMIWMIHNQFGKRNLTGYSRGELAMKLEPLLSAQAKEKEKERKSKTTLATLPKSSKTLNTRKQMSKASGVKERTLAKVKVIAKKADEATKAKLRSGETSINAEYKRLNTHVGHNAGEHEWYTPADFIEAALAVMKSIDCDPASSAIANKTVKAKTFFTKEQDGLNQKWKGSIWLNPPYSQPHVKHFAEAVAKKFTDGEITQACVLVNNATETEWFQTIARVSSAVCFPLSRVKFLTPDGKPGAPLQGQAVLYLGKNATQFCEHFASKKIAAIAINALADRSEMSDDRN